MNEPTPTILSYDNLPAFSTLRREHNQRGLTITAAAEEPGHVMRRRAAMREAVPGALVAAGLLVGLLVFHRLIVRTPHDPAVEWLLIPVYALFCLALFAFIWHQRYRTRMALLERALGQITVLSIQPGRAIIETSGPYGAKSTDIPISDASRFCIVRNRKEDGAARGINALVIDLGDGQHEFLFRGREIEELQWVLNMLQTFGVQSPPT